MFGRPRCREWTPLATQQLRLRSLIQIVGYNIRPPEHCTTPVSYYLTLHHTTMSAPFYTSERISSPHPKWKEIDSESTRRMSTTNIVIRIWCHTLQENSKEVSSSEQQDTIIQTWGVYFTGLRYIGCNLASNFTAECFKTNTLVFQMHGGYFCSYRSLKLDIIPPENDLEHLSSLSSDSSSKTKSFSLDNRLQFTNKLVKTARSISPSNFVRKTEKDCSKSHSPVERFKQSFPSMKTSTSLTIDRNKPDKNVDKEIYEHSPESLDKNCDKSRSNSQIDVSETAENYDFRNETCGVPKYRYFALSFLKSELRPSYNAAKLQKLHLLQYSIKKKQDAVQEIKEKIYKKSALNSLHSEATSASSKSKSRNNIFEIDETQEKTKNNLEVKNELVSSANGSRFSLKLNDLLSFKAIPSPYQRSEHLRLTKQLEILRFKRIILSDERDSKLTNIRRLKQTYSKLYEENQDMGLDLMQKYHTLSRQTDQLKQTRESCAALREISANVHWLMAENRALLLKQLANVFYIDKMDETTWSIMNVPLPISGDEGPKPETLSEAVAAGYAVQCLIVFTAITGLPLRYQIYFNGSATRLVDITPDLADPNIPLYPVSGEVSLFRYGLFLLNKCIVQCMFANRLCVTDLRPTLCNLRTLLTSVGDNGDLSKLYGTYRPSIGTLSPRTQSLRSLVASDRGKHGRQFNRFKESVDGQQPHSSTSIQRHRHSRSVGSYQDDHELSALSVSTTSILGSEPNIYTELTKQPIPQSITTLKPLSSDSNIEQITEKVIFTLGDDTTSSDIDKNRLVKMSTNNGDMASGENVKDICEEINNYCAKDSISYVKDEQNLREDYIITDSGIDFDGELKADDDKRVHSGDDVTSGLVIDNSEIVNVNLRVASDNSRVVSANSEIVGDSFGVIDDNSRVVNDDSEIVNDNSRIVTEIQVTVDNSKPMPGLSCHSGDVSNEIPTSRLKDTNLT